MKIRMGMMALGASAVLAMAGPSSPTTSFNPAITRQDFTGQGTYHRIGLVREQQRALASRPAVASETSAPKSHPSWLARLWQSIFPPRSSASHCSL